MKVSRLSIENFADGDAPTVVNDNVAGEDLVIRGGNRSGKTLTFNALIYGLLGRSATFGVPPGRSTDVSFTFDNGDRLERRPSGRNYIQDGDSFRRDDADEKITELIGSKEILQIQFIHSEIGLLPLSRLSNNDRLSIIRRVTESEIEDKINRLGVRREELETEIEKVERLDLHRTKESLEELEVDSVTNRLSKFQDLQRLIDTGRIEVIRDALLEDKRTREELEELDKQRRSIQKELRKKRRQLSDTRRYDNDVDRLIIDAIQQLTCPVCDNIVQGYLAERRLSRNQCPQCGQKGLITEVRENLEPRVSGADEAIAELEGEIEELEDERDKIESQIASLKESSPELSELNSVAVYALRHEDYDTDTVAANTSVQVQKLESQLEDRRDTREELEQEIADAESRLDELHEKRTAVIEQKEALEQQSFDEQISTFAEAWTKNYQVMAPDLAAEVEIQEDGTIILPGTDRIREYSHLSTGEMRMLNLAFALTLAEHAQENGETPHNWNCLVLDEPFTNIDDEIQLAAIDFLKSSDFQFILTTSDEDVVRHFDTDQVEKLDRITIQSTIDEVLEDE